MCLKSSRNVGRRSHGAEACETKDSQGVKSRKVRHNIVSDFAILYLISDASELLAYSFC